MDGWTDRRMDRWTDMKIHDKDKNFDSKPVSVIHNAKVI